MKRITAEEKARMAEKTLGLIELDDEDLMTATGAEEGGCGCTCCCCTCTCCTCCCGPEIILV